MKLFIFATASLVHADPAYVKVKFGDPCPKNSDFNIWGRCVCNQDSYFDAEKNSCLRNQDFSNWKQVNGYFSGYPLSIEHNRFDDKEEALNMCAKHFDCGGVSQNGDGTFECRAMKFIPEDGAISFKKPGNFKSPMYSDSDVDPNLITAVKKLVPSDFEFADRSYDAGQYQYMIDGNFEPKQMPGVHLGSFSRMTNYENHWAIFYENGMDFYCPKARSTVMFFQCGAKNQLKYVQELQPCTYKFSVDVKC